MLIARSTRSEAWRAGQTSWRSCLTPQETELDERDRRDHDEHRVRNRAGVTEMEEVEALLVHVDGHGERPVQRTALCHDKWLFEYLQIANGRHYRGEQSCCM